MNPAPAIGWHRPIIGPAVRPFAIAGLIALLSACAMGPDYEPPAPPVPGQFREPPMPGSSIGNLKWWELYEDEDMVRVIGLALANNRDLATAVARIEETRARLGLVRSDQFPQLNAEGSASRGNAQTGFPTDFISETYVLAGVLSYEVDLWGKLRRATEAARAELLASVESRNAVTTALIADVASLYLLLADLDHRMLVAQRTLDSRQEALDIIEARFDKGVVSLLDVNQAQIERADAAAQLAALERQNLQTENLLSVLLGQNPGPIQRAQFAFDSLAIPEVPAGLPSELIERRPDVRQAAALLHAQTARIGIAQALRWPSFSLTGTLGLASNDLSNFVDGDNKIWSVGADFFAPLFDGGRNKRRVEAEIARTEQLLAQYEQTVLRALQEVEDALVAIRTFHDETFARQQQVSAATSAANLSRARYDGGVTSYLEVLDSERSLFAAELQASASRREQLNAVVGLYKALGGGWVTEEEIERAGSALRANTPPGTGF